MDSPLPEAFRPVLEAWLAERRDQAVQVLDAALREELERWRVDGRLLDQLGSQVPPPPPPPTTGFSGDLESERHIGSALDLLEGAASQGEVLQRLLDGLVPLVERSALFVLKQGIANLYAHRGFESEAPRPGAPVVPPPELEALVLGRTSQIRQTGPSYAALLGPLSKTASGDFRIFPIRLKRKAVALVLVDSGLRQKLDHPEHARVLVLAASAVLATLAAPKEEEAPRPAAAPEPVPSAPTQVIPEPLPEPPAGDLDPKTRSAAERLARVLVSDVELYFPAKVSQGRTQGNLYGLLREELERSRTTFLERFGDDLEAEHRIFFQAVVGQLCEGDPGKLGAAPWR